MNDDLKEALEMLIFLYKYNNIDFSILEAIIIKNKWFMAMDSDDISIAFNLIGELSIKKEFYQDLNDLIGFKLNEIALVLLEKDSNYRGILLSILNLMSKKINKKELLFERNILRTTGLNFDYSYKDLNVGLIGFGVYLDKFYGKCKEFYGFDLRSKFDFSSVVIGKNQPSINNKNLILHVGQNAISFKDILEKLDIIVMTGSTIVNNTYLDILRLCRNAKIKGIYGPSSQLLPDYLFSKGFNYIMSTDIVQKDEFLEHMLSPILQKEREFDYMELYELKMVD